jgi:hypothetical protein
MTIDLRFDETTGTYRADVDWSGDLDPSVAVVHAVLAATGREEAELDPLNGAVDAEALDRFLRHTGRVDSNARVSFTYEGYEVTLDADGRVELRPTG